MNKLRKTILLALGLLPMMMPVDAASMDDLTNNTDLSSTSDSALGKSRFSLGLQSGSRNIGSVDILAPFMGDDDFIVYTNLRATISTTTANHYGSVLEGSLGLGVRRVNDNETAIYGVYAFYDYLKSEKNNDFQQLTIGAERLGLTWDFRANAYIPIGQTEYNENKYEKSIFSQHSLTDYYKTVNEKAVAGGDIEIGRTIGTNQLHGYVAMYSFGKGLTGPRMRLEYKLNHNFSFNSSMQYDKNRGAQYLLGIRYSIGGSVAKNAGSIYNRLTDEVVRDIDIATVQSKDEHNNVNSDVFWAVDTDRGPGGDGTIENPYGTIESAINDAPENAIIYVKGKSHDAYTLQHQLSMKDGQILWGGSNALYWNPKNKTVSLYKTDDTLLLQDIQGARQTISGTLEMANNSSIYGFNIIADTQAQEHQGILVNNKKNVTIYDVNISGFHSTNSTPYSGLNVIGNSTVDLSNTTLVDNDHGIYADGGALTLNNVTVDGSSNDGIFLNNTVVNGNNITVTNSADNGIHSIDSNIVANYITLKYNKKNGFINQQGTVTIDTADISNNTLHGLYLQSGTANFNNAVLDGNGDLEKISNDVNSIRDLNSAILIGTDTSDAIFNATHLTVSNNAAGIELIAGKINLNWDEGCDDTTLISNIDSNLGYGLFIHADDGAATDFERNVNIANTDMTNTKKLNQQDKEFTTSGHGILSDRTNILNIKNSNISNNAGNGLWHRRGSVFADTVSFNGNGTVSQENFNTNPNLNLFNYGIRLDQTDQAASSYFTGYNLTTKDNNGHGILMTGGQTYIKGLLSENNEDGVMFVNGQMKLVDVTILDNKRFGVYVKYDWGSASKQTDIAFDIFNGIIKGTKNSYESDFKRGTGHAIVLDSLVRGENPLISFLDLVITENDGLGMYLTQDFNVYLNNANISFNGAHNDRLNNVGGKGSEGIKAGGIYQESYSSSHGEHSNFMIADSNISDNYGSGVIFWDESLFDNMHTQTIIDSTIQYNQGVGIRVDRAEIRDTQVNNNVLMSQFLQYNTGAIYSSLTGNSTISAVSNIVVVPHCTVFYCDG